MTQEEKQQFFKQEVAKLDEMIAEISNEIDVKLEEAKKGKAHLELMRETFASQIDSDQLELELVD